MTSNVKKSKKRSRSRKREYKDPLDAVIEKHLNNPLVIEIMDKYKELEKQPGYEFQDKPLSAIIP